MYKCALVLFEFSYFKAFIGFFIRSIWAVVSVVILERITSFLESWNVEGFYACLIFFIVFILIFYYIRIFVVRDWTWVALSSKWSETVYHKYIKKFIRLEWTYVDNIWTWKMIAILSKWIDYRIWSLIFILEYWISSVIFFIFSFISIYLLAWRLFALIFLFLCLIVRVVSYYLNKRVLKYRKLSNEVEDENTRALVRIIMSKFEILQSKKDNLEINRIQKNIDQIFKYTKMRSRDVELIFVLPQILVYWLRILLLLVIWIWILQNNADYSDLVLFTWVVWLMEITIQNVSALLKNIPRDFVPVQRLRDTFDNIPNIERYDIWEKFDFKKWNISINNITFWYDNKVVFDDFSLSLKWWTKSAFVWESWWWKTTLVKLLSWYIKPIKWEILIDWQDLWKIRLIDYYKNIWYLSQEPSIFDWTIYENLIYSFENSPTEQDIEKVIKLSKCEFIWELEKWVHTEIGERWIRLSWWQKQRLAIAKIMLKNPNIIFLDEPTSALDSYNEEQINIALGNLFEWKTVIIIAHRLQTVKKADRILLFEEWKVVEDWNHAQLVELNWKYKKMLDLQSGF